MSEPFNNTFAVYSNTNTSLNIKIHSINKSKAEIIIRMYYIHALSKTLLFFVFWSQGTESHYSQWILLRFRVVWQKCQQHQWFHYLNMESLRFYLFFHESRLDDLVFGTSCWLIKHTVWSLGCEKLWRDILTIFSWRQKNDVLCYPSV